jgi:CBS domain-containing protein
MKISSVMSKDVQLTKPDDTLRSAATLMKEIDAGLLPVTENDELVGMITDRDIATLPSGMWLRGRGRTPKSATQ